MGSADVLILGKQLWNGENSNGTFDGYLICHFSGDTATDEQHRIPSIFLPSYLLKTLKFPVTRPATPHLSPKQSSSVLSVLWAPQV